MWLPLRTGIIVFAGLFWRLHSAAKANWGTMPVEIAGYGRTFVAGLVLTVLCGTGAAAQSKSVERANAPQWTLHGLVEDANRPGLCPTAYAANSITSIILHALEAQQAGDKSRMERLLGIAAQYQREICRTPAPDDVIFVRCRIDDVEAFGTRVTIAKLSAIIKSEITKGERAFYAWTYADIREAPKGDKRAQEQHRRWCTDQGQQANNGEQEGGPVKPDKGGGEGADSAVVLTSDLLLRLQQRLYDFGYSISVFDGTLQQELVQAVAAFQRNAGLEATGQITRRTVELIDSTPTPGPWVAIAFLGNGRYGTSSGQLTRRAAEQAALQQLRRRNRSGDPRISSASGPACLSLATTNYTSGSRRNRVNHTQAFTNGARDKAGAIDAVLAYCNREKGGGTCRVRHTECIGTSAAPSGDGQGRHLPGDQTAGSSGGGSGRHLPGDQSLGSQGPVEVLPKKP